MSRSPAASFVLTCIFLDALGIGLIIPVLPRLIGTLSASADEQTIWYGAIMASYGLMQFFSAPVIGAISDRKGRRPVLLGGIFGLSLMMFVPAVAQSPVWILLSRIAGGAMSSNIVVAQAYIADVTPADNRTAAFGRIGAIFGIAFILGPALGGILGEDNPRLPFLCASVICLLNFLYGLFILPESLKHPLKTPFDWRELNPFHTIGALSKERFLMPILVIITLCTLSQSLVQCTWALYTEFRYGWTPASIGISIFALGAAITIVQGALLPLLAKKFAPKHIILFGLFAGLLSLFGIGLSKSGAAAAVFVCAFSVMGIVGPTLQSIISRLGSPSAQGIRLGAAASLNSFTGAVSPALGTPLLFFTSSQNSGEFSAGTPYYLFACLILAAIIIWMRRQTPNI